MKRIDSDALGFMNKALGISGAGAAATELTDGIVDQSLEVNELVRRGRTLAGTEGLYIFRLRNNHVGAGGLTAQLNPFIPGALAHPPFPETIPTQFDLWMLNASVFLTGVETISGVLFINYPAHMMGASVTNAGGQVAAGVTSHAVAFWDTIVNENVAFGTQGSPGRGPMAFPGLRIPRARTTQLVWATTSTGVSTMDINIVVGLFPVALGQDGLV